MVMVAQVLLLPMGCMLSEVSSEMKSGLGCMVVSVCSLELSQGFSRMSSWARYSGLT